VQADLGRTGRILILSEQQPHVSDAAKRWTPSLAGRPRSRRRSRQLGQIQDERAPRLGAGVPQEGNAVAAELPRDLDGREIGRLGHDQAKDHLAES
jgi:hypothetical protein